MSVEAADVVVVGAGAAGLAAARAAHEAGATVTLVASGEGATALGGGVIWGESLEPWMAWGDRGEWQSGGVYATVGGWLVAGALGALGSLLDIPTAQRSGTVGVVDWPVDPSWSARLVAQTLGGRVLTVRDLRVGEGFLQAAAGLDDDGAVERLATGLRDDLSGVSGVLFPPVLGLQRRDVSRRLTQMLDRPVGEAVGPPGGPPGVRVYRALHQGLPAGVTVVRSVATVDIGGAPTVRTSGGGTLMGKSVVLATGGLVGGGLVFERTLREATAGGVVWTRGRQRVLSVAGSAQGADPGQWFGDTPETSKATGAGLRVDPDGRVLGADGEAVPARWLFAVGEVVAARDPDQRYGMADALASGARVGVAAARHALEG